MSKKQFIILRLLIIAVVAITVSTAVSVNNFWLAIVGVATGMLFMTLVRSGYKKVIVDEMIENISGKAARASYSISVMVLLFLSIFFIIAGDQKEDIYVEALGIVFSFVVLLQVVLYSITFYYHKYRYGNGK